MNQTATPSLSNVISGFEFNNEPCRKIDVDLLTREMECINLLSKLENALARAMEQEKDDFFDEAAEHARNVLTQLTECSSRFLGGGAAEQANEEIDNATVQAFDYEAVLKNRPLTNAFLRLFWDVDERPEIIESHNNLGDALVRACTVTFYHVVMAFGLDSEIGKEIDQSALVFVNQLKESWGK